MLHHSTSISNASKQSTRLSFLLPFAVAALFALAGCGADLGDCPTNPATQQAAGKTVLTTQCASCHGPNYAGGPVEGLDFTSDSVVKDEATSMYDEAAGGSMPPTGKLSDADLEALRVYLACTQ